MMDYQALLDVIEKDFENTLTAAEDYYFNAPSAYREGVADGLDEALSLLRKRLYEYHEAQTALSLSH